MHKLPPLLLLSFLFLFFSAPAQSLKLRRNDQIRSLSHYKVVYFVAFQKDSTQREVLMADSAGVFVRKDTAYIRPQLHNLYRYYKNGMTYSRVETFPDTTKQRIRLALKDIERIDIERPIVDFTCGSIASASLLSALVLSPILASRGGFNADTFYKMEGASLGTFALAVLIRQTIGVHHFYLKHRKISKNWTVMP
jgi:hypothetical protein